MFIFSKAINCFGTFCMRINQYKTIQSTAISAYAANQLDHEDPYPFCPNLLIIYIKLQ